MEDGRLNSKLDMGERKGGGELKLQGKKKKKKQAEGECRGRRGPIWLMNQR